MHRLLISSVLLFSAAAFGETWNGTLMDVMCEGKDATSHTRQCAIACAKSGYGIVLADGKFLKFNDQGNAKTLAALKSTKKDKDLKTKVTGKLESGVIAVDSLDIL